MTRTRIVDILREEYDRTLNWEDPVTPLRSQNFQPDEWIIQATMRACAEARGNLMTSLMED